MFPLLNLAVLCLSSCSLFYVHVAAQYGIGGAYNFGGVFPGNVVPGTPVGGTPNVVPGTPVNGLPFFNGGFGFPSFLFNTNQNSNANSNTNTAQANSGAAAGAGNNVTTTVTNPVAVPPIPVLLAGAAVTAGLNKNNSGVVTSINGVDTVNFDPDQNQTIMFTVESTSKVDMSSSAGASLSGVAPEEAVLVGSR